MQEKYNKLNQLDRLEYQIISGKIRINNKLNYIVGIFEFIFILSSYLLLSIIYAYYQHNYLLIGIIITKIMAYLFILIHIYNMFIGNKQLEDLNRKFLNKEEIKW